MHTYGHTPGPSAASRPDTAVSAAGAFFQNEECFVAWVAEAVPLLPAAQWEEGLLLLRCWANGGRGGSASLRSTTTSHFCSAGSAADNAIGPGEQSCLQFKV